MTKTDLELIASHRYRLLDGRIATNVTSVTGMVDDGKSMGMAHVAAKLTREGLDYRSEWNAKRDLGTRTHAVCELWLRGEESFVSDEDAGFVDALGKFFVDHDPHMIECEAVVLSTTHGYGGRLDFIAGLNDGRTLLIDLKTGKRYPVEHSMQLAAYRFADGIAVYDADGSLVSLRPVPAVDACACLYVRADGTYALDEYPADERWFGHFCAVLRLRQDMHGAEMAALVKAAKEGSR